MDAPVLKREERLGLRRTFETPFTGENKIVETLRTHAVAPLTERSVMLYKRKVVAQSELKAFILQPAFTHLLCMFVLTYKNYIKTGPERVVKSIARDWSIVTFVASAVSVFIIAEFCMSTVDPISFAIVLLAGAVVALAKYPLMHITCFERFGDQLLQFADHPPKPLHWQTVPYDDYERFVPERTKELAVSLQEHLGDKATLWVEEAVPENNGRLWIVDPFLIIVDPATKRRFYVDFWDETDYRIECEQL